MPLSIHAADTAFQLVTLVYQCYDREGARNRRQDIESCSELRDIAGSWQWQTRRGRYAIPVVVLLAQYGSDGKMKTSHVNRLGNQRVSTGYILLGKRNRETDGR